MKKLCLIIIFTAAYLVSNAQTSQVTIGNKNIVETFYDNKIDPVDGSTISVGFMNDPAGFTGNDLLMVKFNAAHDIVWQRIMQNSGDDVFYKVIVCANGDYIAVGQKNSSGVTRGVVCRFNNSGTLLWSSVTTNTGSPQNYRDVVETTAGNIAVVGMVNSVTAKSFLVLLDASGNYLNQIYTITPSANEFRAISLLPNGNLIAAGYLNSGSSTYYALIAEFNPTTLAQVSSNRYSINTAVPGGVTNTSLWPTSVWVKNNTVLISCDAFQGLSSTRTQAIYSYNLTTRALSGNLYYEPGNSNSTSFSFQPLSENDFLIGQSYSSPAVGVSVSRVTAGIRIYDRKINSNVNNIYSISSYNGNISCAGTILNTNTDAFNLFSSTDLPATTSPCNISDLNTLSLQVSNLTPMSYSLTWSSTSVPNKPVLVFGNFVYIPQDACNPPAAQTAYTFTGNGGWSISGNWANALIPPAVLPSGSTIIINPVQGGSCIALLPQQALQGSQYIVAAGAKLIVDWLTINVPVYQAVTICGTDWMNKNLDVYTYRNGDPIPQASNATEWANLTTGAYCYLNNDSASYAATYGKLYNWYAVNDPRGLAPVGWHVASTTEWSSLRSCLGGISVAGGPVKEAGFTHWISPNTGATNSTGFTGLPGGWRANTGSFSAAGYVGFFWTSTDLNATEAFGAGLFNDTESLNPTTYLKVGGSSVRCVKD